MRCHKNPTQETTQAQQTPTTPTAATSAGALHPIRGATPDKGALHPNRRGALPTDRVQRPNTQEHTRN